MQRKNLSTKKITDFTPEDTIYITDSKDERKPFYLCQFKGYDTQKRVVTGIILDERENNAYGSRKAGVEISAYIDKCGLYGNSTSQENWSYFRRFDYSGYAMHPLEEHKILEDDLHISKHPCFGMARFSRVSGGSTGTLFGTSIVSNQFIELTISRGTHNRGLSSDNFFSGKELIRIAMSNNQFAELISSFNYGSGIPVTIKDFNGETYPSVQFLSKADIFSGEFKKSMQNQAVDLKIASEKVNEILEKPTISKADRKTISDFLARFINKVTDNVPFVQQQFQEAMDKVVLEAKTEVEAYIENKIRAAGLEKLGFNKETDTPLIDTPKEDYHDRG